MMLDLVNPPTLSAETLARLDAMTPAEIERNAETDADNPPMTDIELAKLRSAAWVRSIRQGLDMTQVVFADTFGIAVGRLRDWEQGRFMPDDMARRYLEVIRRVPEIVADAKGDIREESRPEGNAPERPAGP